jgi:pimeloyl-ACP methyl ester carboxylesterase
LADPFDHRGVDLLDHARTFLHGILDALERSAADVVANSIGGLWSVAFAIDEPNRVSRLVLAGRRPGSGDVRPSNCSCLGCLSSDNGSPGTCS